MEMCQDTLICQNLGCIMSLEPVIRGLVEKLRVCHLAWWERFKELEVDKCSEIIETSKRMMSQEPDQISHL